MPGERPLVGTRHRIPDTDGPVRTAARQQAVVDGTESRAEHGGGVPDERSDELPGVGVPQVQLAVLGPARQKAAIEGAEGQAQDRRQMFQGSPEHPGREIPQGNCQIETCADQRRAVRAYDCGGDGSRMQGEGGKEADGKVDYPDGDLDNPDGQFHEADGDLDDSSDDIADAATVAGSRQDA